MYTYHWDWRGHSSPLTEAKLTLPPDIISVPTAWYEVYLRALLEREKRAA